MWGLRSVLIVAMVLLPTGTFQADTFPVTKTNDTSDGTCDPDCSLREAIEAANANAGPDDVPVPAGNYLLSLGQLTVLDDVGIAGAGQTNTIIDGNGMHRVFYIQAPAAVVEISGVTIQNGASYAIGGGGVLNLGTLTLTESTVTGSYARYGGGGIYNDGTLTLSYSSVSGNNGAYGGGGGIFNYGTLALTDTTVSGNGGVFGPPFAYSGGGILNYGGPVTLVHSTVSDNYAYVGGGIHGSMTLTDSTVSENEAGLGGGTYTSGTLTLTRTTVSGNTGHLRGGGIYNRGTVTLTESQVEANTAGRGGGGIFNRNSELTLIDSTVSDNFSGQYGVGGYGGGGGISNRTTGVSLQSTVMLIRTTVSENESVDGGGIVNTEFLGGGGAALTLLDSTVSGNLATGNGGGIHNGGEGTVTLTHSTVSENDAASQGDGIYSQLGGSIVEASHSIVAGNLGGNCNGPFSSLGYNLSDDATCFSVSGSDLVAPAQLGPLADNGGPTLTHLPLAGSPAIDAGDNTSCPAIDQRGITRPQDGNQPPDGFADCDIGAVEVVPEPALLWQIASGIALLLLIGRRRICG